MIKSTCLLFNFAFDTMNGEGGGSMYDDIGTAHTSI